MPHQFEQPGGSLGVEQLRLHRDPARVGPEVVNGGHAGDTCVLHLEHGEWRMVQWHGSIPTTNEEHGFFLTKSVDQIAEAVSESRPDLTGSSASDGTVTIAFTDIEDSTKLNVLLGDRRWLEVLRVHNEVVTDVTAEHGGTVVKGQGDGFMLAFASARAH